MAAAALANILPEKLNDHNKDEYFCMKKIFGFVEPEKHDMISYVQSPREKFKSKGIDIGSVVAFSYDSQILIGIVKNIVKNATIVVPGIERALNATLFNFSRTIIKVNGWVICAVWHVPHRDVRLATSVQIQSLAATCSEHAFKTKKEAEQKLASKKMEEAEEALLNSTAEAIFYSIFYKGRSDSPP
uniref:Uncharacterized protein n=1 Tax=Aureoumbra lagunensis TaxID=44058 RepID=A0A7S3JU71_9STRA